MFAINIKCTPKIHLYQLNNNNKFVELDSLPLKNDLLNKAIIYNTESFFYTKRINCYIINRMPPNDVLPIIYKREKIVENRIIRMQDLTIINGKTQFLDKYTYVFNLSNSKFSDAKLVQFSDDSTYVIVKKIINKDQ
jgi:hypothetical protein